MESLTLEIVFEWRKVLPCEHLKGQFNSDGRPVWKVNFVRNRALSTIPACVGLHQMHEALMSMNEIMSYVAPTFTVQPHSLPISVVLIHAF